MLGFLSTLLGGRKHSKKKKSCSCSNSCTQSLKSLKGKGLRFEPLEARQLLSVSPVILDNGDTQHYQEAGSSWASWSDPNAYGQNFRYHAQGDGTNTASWTFDTLEAGKNYQLFATYTAEANRSSNAPFTVLDGSTSLATVRINEHFEPIDNTFGDHGWQSLGTYHTDTGSLTIRLSDDANGYVIADAVAAVEVPPVTVAPTVVDNANPAYSEQGSDWQGWNDTTAYSDAIRYHAPGTGQYKATWTFEALDPEKSYRLLATWSAYDSHASNAPYTVSDDTTPLATVRLNQRFAPNSVTLDGQDWQNVGTYNPTSGKLVVSLSDDADGYAIADAIRLVEVPPLTNALSVIDNSDAAYGETGENWLLWSETWAYQGDFRYHSPGTGQNTATWTFESLDPAKRYQIYSTWSPQPNRSTNSPFTILDNTNPLATVRVNQQFAPAHTAFDEQSWESLGTYQFVSGKLTVSLSDDVSSGYVVADAVRIVEVPEVTAAPLAVDNADAAYSEIGEGWLTWSETGAYQGDFRYHVAGTSQNAATWTFDKLDSTKQYRVYATWSAQSNRAIDAPYTILDDQTSMGTVRVNQQLAPESATFDNQAWQILGTYHFASGKLTVTLADDATSGNVVADAIYVEEVSQVPGGPGIADNTDAVYTETGSSWSDHSGSGDYLDNSRRHVPGSGESKARWQFTDLPAGHYDIYATWTATADQATDAPFTVYDGSNLAGTERVNQQLAPASEAADGAIWQLVGSYWIESGQMRVELSDDADGVVAADAIRIVDPVAWYWDPDHDSSDNVYTTGEGLGYNSANDTWNTTTADWVDESGNYHIWNGGANTVAIFWGTAGAVPISSSVTASWIDFKSTGYTIQGGSLYLSYSPYSIQVDADTATISTPIRGSGLTKTGAGTLVLSGTSNYSGATAIQNGTLVLSGSSGNLPSSTIVTLGTGSTGGTLQLGDATTARNQTIAGLFKSGTGTNRVVGGNASSNSILTVNVSGTDPFGGILGGNGDQNNLSLTKTGSGQLTLSGANTFSGATTISAGTLALTNSNALQNSTVIYNYGTLNLSGVSAVTLGGLEGSRNLTLPSNTLTVGGNNSSTTYSGVLSGSGSLTKTGTGILTLSGASTYSGMTAIRNGTVKLSGGDNRLPRNYGNTLKLGYSNGGTTTTGILDLGGYSQMIVDFTNDPAVPSSCQIIGNSSTTSDSTLNCSLYLGGTFAGVIQDTLPSGGTKKTALHVGVGGTLTLTGANTFSGDTRIDEDEDENLVLSNQNALQNSTVLNMPTFDSGLTSATFGGLSGSEGLALRSGFTLTVGGNNASTTYSGVLSGPGSLVKTGSGTLTLSGANTFSGATTISVGTLALTNSNALQNSTVIYDYGTLNLSGVSAVILGGLEGSRNLTLPSNTLTVGGNNSNTTYSGVLSGNGSLTKTGTGTFTLSGQNSFNGTTTILVGNLEAMIPAALPGYSQSGRLSVSTGATMAVYVTNNNEVTNWESAEISSLLANPSFTMGNIGIEVAPGKIFTYENAINGTRGLVKLGTGTLKLSGSTANMYAGGTTISAGMLEAITPEKLPGYGQNGLLSVSDGATVAVYTTYESDDTYWMPSEINSLVGNTSFAHGNLGIEVANGNDYFYSGTIDGSRGLVKLGLGSLYLIGTDNDYSGKTTITEGALHPSYWNIPGTIGTGDVEIAENAALICDYGLGSTTLSNKISGSGDLDIYYNYPLLLTGNLSDYTGMITLYSGSTLSLTDVNGSLALGTCAVTGTGYLEFDHSNIQSFGGVISSDVNVTKKGTGTLTLSGANTYSGNTSIIQGTLAVSDMDNSDESSNVGNGPNPITLSDGTYEGILSYTGDSTNFDRGFIVTSGGSGRINVADGKTLTLECDSQNFQNAGVLTIGGAGNTTITSNSNLYITSGGTLFKTDAGTLSIINTSSTRYFYCDDVTVDEGKVDTQGEFLFVAARILDGGILQVSGKLDMSSPLVNQGTLIIEGQGNVGVGTPSIIGNSAALSGTELYATWIGFDQSNVEVTKYISLDGTNYLPFTEGNATDTSVLISGVNPNTHYYIKVVVAHADGITEIYQSGLLHTASTDTSGWYKIDDIIPDTSDPVKNLNPTGENAYILSSLLPADTTEAIGTPYAWGYSLGTTAPETIGVYQKIGSWTFAGSKQGAFLQSILGLITDGSIPTLDEQGQVTFCHTLEIHEGAVQQDLGYSFVPAGGYSQIMHFPGTSTTQGPLTFDPNPPCTCPGSGNNAGVPSGTTGGSVVGITPIDSTGGCVPCGGGSSALTYQSRGNNFDSGFGPGWSNAGEMPTMIVARNTVAIQSGGNSSYYFDYSSGSGFTPRYCSTQTLLHDPVNNLYIFTQTDGTRYEFDDDIQTTHPAGTLRRSISPSGATTQVTAWTASGKIAEVRYKTTPSGSPYEIKQYAYYTSGSGRTGHVESITLLDGQSNILRITNYDYYAAGESYGSEGDLKTIVSQKWDPTLNGGTGGLSSSTTSETNYFRYYTTTGKEHLLKRMLLPNAYAGFVSSYGDPANPSNDNAGDGPTDPLSNFTCFYYEYDGNRRITKSVVFGKSNESNFTNDSNPNTTSKGYNIWYRKSVETRLDGTTNTIYTNFIGQTLLTDLHDLAADTHTITYSHYDNDGRVVLAAETSAFVVQNGKFYDDTLPDLVDFGTGETPHSPYLSDTAGMFLIITYYTTDNPGEAKGQVHQKAVAQGESAARKTPGSTGGPVLHTSYAYDSHTVDYGFDTGISDQVTLHPVSTKTTYPDGDPAHGVSTTYAYTWNTTYPDRFQIQQSTTTLPAVSSGQNGSDHTSATKTWSNNNGNVVWSMNQIGRVTYTHYDSATNLPDWTIEDIDDVKAASLALTIPAGWDLPDSDGANQLTEYQYDALRRVIRVLGPKHLVDIGTYGTWVRSATWTVYNDGNHETRTAQGYAAESVPNSGTWDTFTIVGPISIQKTDLDGRVTNQIQATYANPPTNAGLPAALATATFTRSVYVSWTAYQYKKTKLWKTAVYYNIPFDSASNGADGFVGDKDVNFNMTTVGYENFGAADYALIGRQNKTISTGGTITRYVFDARGNVLETWIGTHDQGATDANPGNHTALQTNDMVKVASYLYDADGNVSQSTQYADSDNHDLDRVTKYFYDGLDRLVYTVNPADAQGQVTYSKNYYDNLNRVVMQQTYYDADDDLFDVSFNPETTDLAGHLAQGTISGIVYGDDRLLSCTTTDYDNLGRVYRSTNYAVDPSNGQLVNNGQNTATSLSSNVWRDAAGRVIKQEAAGSQTFTKTAYNGLGQVKSSYVGYDAVGGESISNLYDYQGNVNLDLADDIILSQTEYAYDDGGNTLFVTNRQRNATAASNDYDALEFSNSRSTYVGYWYDGFGRQIATGDYGDNDDIQMTPGMRQVHTPPWNNTCGILINRMEYNAQGRAQSFFDALNHETRYTQYDDAGRVKQIVQNYQDGTYTPGTNNSTTDQDIITTYDYATNGKIWKQTDTLDHVTEYLYNGLGQLETRKDPDPDGAATVYYSPTTTYTYNNLGEILTTTQSDAAPTPTLTRTTTYTYDNLGRQRTVTQEDPDGQPGGEVAPSTTTAYDVRGNVYSVTDALGHATTYSYDAWNRLTTQTDAANHSTTYTYYDTGAMWTLTDPELNTTTWTYDKLNHVVQEQNELSKSRYYTYDGGLLSRVKDRNNRITDYDYDRYGRQFHEYWYTDEDEAEDDPYHNNPDYYFQYQYDELGNLIDAVAVSAAGNGSGYSYALDDLGRATLIVSGYYFDVSLPSVSLSQQYDDHDNRLQLSTNVDSMNDFVNDYQYDNLGRMTQVQQHSQTPGSSVASKRVDFTYLADGQFDAITRYANLAGTQKVGMGDYDYDNAGRLTSLTYGDFPTGSSPAPAYTWNWDEGNRITQFTSKTDAATGPDPATVDYNYDVTNQLANVGATPAAVYSNWATWTGVQSENYEYDDNGNRTNGDYEVGGDNQMTADNAGFTYTYDDEGNRTEKFVWTDDGDGVVENAEKSNLTEYHWDNRNRLTDVVHRSVFGGAADWSEHNDYDYLNRLIHQDIQQGTSEKQTLYAYDGNQIALQFEKNGSDPIAPTDLAHRYLWGPAVDQLLADEALTAIPPGQGSGFDLSTPGETRWALGDNLNSVRDLATYDGVTTSVIAHRVFDAFGVLKSETDPSNNHQPTNIDCHLYYTGKLYDNVTQLQNNINRWYEPASGKWTSADPESFVGGDANLYRYVGNAPEVYMDPLGLAEIGPAKPSKPNLPPPPQKADDIKCAADALAYIDANDYWLRRSLIDEFTAMLSTVTPKGAIGANWDSTCAKKAAEALADAYIKTVTDILNKWPGAKPRQGIRWADYGRYKPRTDAEIAQCPICEDWAGALLEQLDNKIKPVQIECHGVKIDLSNIVDINWGQRFLGMIEPQHNFVIICPKGYLPKTPGEDPDIRVCDPWLTLLPGACAPEKCKYRVDYCGKMAPCQSVPKSNPTPGSTHEFNPWHGGYGRGGW